MAGLPVVAGPILLAITLLQGPTFGAEAAASTMLGLIGLAAFVLVYGWSSLALGPIASVFLGWAGFLATVALLSLVDPPPAVAFAAACAAFALATLALPEPPPDPPVDHDPTAWDLPLRAVAAFGLVVAVTTASGALGPKWSGLLAPFPIVTSVLAAFTHAQLGRRDTQFLLRGFLAGFYAFALFCFVLAIALPEMATGYAFALALGAAVTLQAVVGTLTRPRQAS